MPDCRLCLTPRPLQRSHIVTEFLYESTYDYRHRFVLVPSPKSGRPKFEQLGLRERLLCIACEGRLAQYETYAARAVYGDHALAATESSDFVVFHDVDYLPFKLFLLANLWRAGEASLPTFRSVDLAPHADTIRRMLLEGDPGEPNCFPCMVMCPQTVPGSVARAILPPEHIELGHYQGYRFIICGVLYVFVVSPCADQSIPPQTYLSRAGDFPVDLDRSGYAQPLFEEHLRRLVALKRAHVGRGRGSA